MTKSKDQSQHPNYDLLCMVQDICGDVRKQRAALNSIERQLGDLLLAIAALDEQVAK